jgi:toxin ParE1/3/4
VNAHFVVKPKADQDLERYADYVAKRSTVNVALRFFAAAQDTFSLLATQPQMGWRSRLNHARLKSLRVFRVAGFERMLILYRPLREGIEVLRVVHGSRNLQTLFRRREEIE